MKTNWICAAITLFIIGCSAIPFEVVRRGDEYEKYEVAGTIVQECVVISRGCTFHLAIRDEPDLAEVFVPWGNRSYQKIRDMPVHAYVNAVVVDRGDGSYVLRSLKEIR